MSYWSPDGLTPVERRVQGMQVREKRCGACQHRTVEVFPGHWGCVKDLSWPKGGRCGAFALDEQA